MRLGWSSAALIFSAAPHLPRMPIWISLLTLTCLTWRMTAAIRGWPTPWQWLRLLLALFGLAAVVGSYGTVNGVEAGSALLVVMMNMKVLETRQRRDFQVLMFISYFLILAQLLYEPGIWTVLYMGAAVWLTTTALMQSVRRGPALPPWNAARLVARMLALAVPVMAVLFLLFPRVPGPFWSMPTRGGAGTTGLSDSMSPGAISTLSQSDAVAFRVSFDGRVPIPRQRYWRGPVLHEFDGATWREPARLPVRELSADAIGPAFNYRITMEPHDRPWLLALDYPGGWSATRAFLTYDYQLLSRHPVDQLTAYDAVSYPESPIGMILRPMERRIDLSLPRDRNPRSVALAREMRERFTDDRRLMTAVLARFTQNPYVYTLRPPALRGADPVDEFLFETRRGFCEHYASSFTVLMRAAGIPARVVTGYQGGELNPLNKRMTVRQSDAHAWSEVWLPGEGWIRVDPTAAVAPSRIELSLADAVPYADLAPGRLLRTVPILQNLQQAWDAADSAWNEWILGYGPDQQIALLRSLGVDKPDWRSLTVLLGATLAALLAGLTLWTAWRYRRPQVDEVQRLYQRYARRLARHGIRREPWEGPLHYCDRAVRSLPAFAGAMRGITTCYLRLRYEGRTEPEELVRMRRLVRTFRP